MYKARHYWRDGIYVLTYLLAPRLQTQAAIAAKMRKISPPEGGSENVREKRCKRNGVTGKDVTVQLRSVSDGWKTATDSLPKHLGNCRGNGGRAL